MADTAAASTRAEEPSGSMTEAKREISAVQLLTKDGQDRQGKQDLAEQAVRWGIKLTPPLGKFLIELAFELAGLAAVVAFGVYAVKSVTVANRGNSFSDLALLQALISNQLTLLTLCLSSSGNEVSKCAFRDPSTDASAILDWYLQLYLLSSGPECGHPCTQRRHGALFLVARNNLDSGLNISNKLLRRHNGFKCSP